MTEPAVIETPDAPVDAPVDAPAVVDAAPAPAPEPEPAPAAAEAPVDAPADEGDWRTRMAGGDDKKLAAIDNYGSEQAVVDALIAAKQKIRSGDMLPKLSDKPTDDELSAYRKDMGIPETADGYDPKLPEGFAFGEADKPYLDKALKAMHDANATPKQIEAMLGVHAANLEEEALELAGRDQQDLQTTEDALRSEWGNEYRANFNIVQNYMETAPEGVRDMLMNGRGADGTAFMNNPEMVRWMNQQAREINPAASVVKMTGRDTMANVQDEINILKAKMDEDINAWHKDTVAKDRYQVLLKAKEKIEARAKK